MHQQPGYADQLHAQARDIAIRLVAAADALPAKKPRATAAQLLAQGPIATEIAYGARCCVDDQLALAVMVAAELALHSRPDSRAAPDPR